MNRIRIVLVGVALTACASPATSAVDTPSAEATATDGPSPSATADHAEGTLTRTPSAIGDGPGIDIPGVLAAAPSAETLVNGWLIVEADGTVWLCESLTDSTPPACAGDRLRVEGFSLPLADDAEEAAGVSWYPQAIQVLGEVTVP